MIYRNMYACVCVCWYAFVVQLNQNFKGKRKGKKNGTRTIYQMTCFVYMLPTIYLFSCESGQICLLFGLRFWTIFTAYSKHKENKNHFESLKQHYNRFGFSCTKSSYEDIYKFLKILSLFIMLLVKRFSCEYHFSKHILSNISYKMAWL